jgi:hypothetical protein
MKGSNNGADDNGFSASRSLPQTPTPPLHDNDDDNDSRSPSPSSLPLPPLLPLGGHA